MTIRRHLFVLAALFGSAASTNAVAAGPVCDAVWHDAARDRDVPVRIRMPGGGGKAPLILFSHGLGGSLDGGTLWGRSWADAGFVVIHLQHPGSDRSVLQSGGGIGGALKAAMSPGQLDARVRDVKFVLDQIPARPHEGRCSLTRIDMAHIGMSGHSFGAHTTQALAGQMFAQTTAATTEPRITASIAFSPSPPRGGSDAQAMANVRKPFFSITGTADSTPAVPDVTAADRERPFRAMPPGGKYLLVLKGATHADFSGNVGGFRRRGPDDHVRQAVIDTSVAFWRWTLMGDRAAKAKLDDPKAIGAHLAPGDRFERR